MIDADALSCPSVKVETVSGLRNSILAGLIVFAVVLRLAVRLALPHLIYADEIFQNIEQAHRLLFGTGQVPWEFQVGIRSWLFPGILAPLLWLGHHLGSNPDLSLLPIKIFMTAVSTAPIICGFLWGERFNGLMGATVTGALSAMWFDNVYFSTHTLSEVFAANCLVVGLYLGYPVTSIPSPKRLFWAGIAFGFTFALRFHLGPAILVALFWIGRAKGNRGYLPLLSGFLLPVCFSGLLDWVTWDYPFQSIWLNIWLNVFNNISGDYGHAPQWYFFIAPIFFWGGACAVVALSAFAGSYRLPLLLVVSFVLLATMTMFQHKEYRFIYPAIPLIIILSGLGTVEGLKVIWERFGNKAARQSSLAALAICFWAATCLAIAVSPVSKPLLTEEREVFAAFHAISITPSICAVALYKSGLTLGVSQLPENVTLDEVDETHILQEAEGFNAVLTEDPTSVPDLRFHKQTCWSNRDDILDYSATRMCLWVRPGTCKPGIATLARLQWPTSWKDSALPKLVLERLHRNQPPASEFVSKSSDYK